MAQILLSFWCHIFIVIPNVEFNQSVHVDSIVNFVIILQIKKWFIREGQYLPGRGGGFKSVAVF
jgi:outer membrane protease